MIKKLLLVLTLYSSVNIGGAIDFNSQPPNRNPAALIAEVNGPVVIEGYTFTPTTWNAWVIPDTTEQDDRPWMYTSPWLGFDDAMTVTNHSRFNLRGFDSIGLQTGPGRLVSSEGHVLNYFTLRHLATHFDLPGWDNLLWVRFEYDYAGFGPNGFDNLDVVTSDARRVPEPATLILFLVVLPFALWMRSRGYR